MHFPANRRFKISLQFVLLTPSNINYLRQKRPGIGIANRPVARAEYRSPTGSI